MALFLCMGAGKHIFSAIGRCEMRNLKKRIVMMKGDDVKRVQTILHGLGLYEKIDGIFGPLTDAAVRKFQELYKIKTDGIVGPVTWGKLEGVIDSLARIVWWEARGEPLLGQVAVGNVVLNRVHDRRWPDTVEEVIAQKSQFTPFENPEYFEKEIPDAFYEIALLSCTEKVVGDDYFYFSVGKPTRYAKDFVKIGSQWFGRDIRD